MSLSKQNWADAQIEVLYVEYTKSQPSIYLHKNWAKKNNTTFHIEENSITISFNSSNYVGINWINKFSYTYQHSQFTLQHVKKWIKAFLQNKEK